MTSSIDVKPGDKVLEIGTGSGYQSAYLSHLTDKVWSIEIIKPLAERTRGTYDELIGKGYNEFKGITSKNADGYYGWAENAPFDKIIVTCGIDHIPPPLLQQLKPGGIMVIPVGPPGAQRVLKVEKNVAADGTDQRWRARTSSTRSSRSCPSPSSKATRSRATTTSEHRRARAGPGALPHRRSWEDFDARSPGPRPSEPAIGPGPSSGPSLPLYLGVGLVAGAVIALQICIMRIFSVGSWAHFGSLVVSLAMLAFGLVSAVMCIGKGFFARRWRACRGRVSLVLFAPLLIAANLAGPAGAVQRHLPGVRPGAEVAARSPISLLYLLPFLAGALFLGTVFLKADRFFARVYFADLVGAGLGGLVFLGTLFLLPPENLVVVPVGLGSPAASPGSCFARAQADARPATIVDARLRRGAGRGRPTSCAAAARSGSTTLAVSDYKGISYARKFPDSHLVYRSTIRPSATSRSTAASYLHFAPGLSTMPPSTCPASRPTPISGLYIDGDGPSGIIRNLKPPNETAYFRFLPMDYPYVVVQGPRHLRDPVRRRHLDRGGAARGLEERHGRGIEPRRPLTPSSTDPALRDFTGDILIHDPRVTVVDYDGRLYLAGHPDSSYDVVDLSLADSAGLSAPGGFAIVEKYAYARQAMEIYMRALRPGGILSVTLWNKEEPPKSILKLYSTHGRRLARACRSRHAGCAARLRLSRTTSSRSRAICRPRPSSTSAAASREAEITARCGPTPMPCRSTRSTMARHRLSMPRQTDGDADQLPQFDLFRCVGRRRPARPRRWRSEAAAGRPGTHGVPASRHRAGRRGRLGPDASAVLPSTLMGRLAWHAPDLRRLGRHRSAATCSTPARSPTTGPISPPM